MIDTAKHKPSKISANYLVRQSLDRVINSCGKSRCIQSFNQVFKWGMHVHKFMDFTTVADVLLWPKITT
jgi:hypothetical protein